MFETLRKWFPTAQDKEEAARKVRLFEENQALGAKIAGDAVKELDDFIALTAKPDAQAMMNRFAERLAGITKDDEQNPIEIVRMEMGFLMEHLKTFTEVKNKHCRESLADCFKLMTDIGTGDEFGAVLKDRLSGIYLECFKQGVDIAGDKIAEFVAMGVEDPAKKVT